MLTELSMVEQRHPRTWVVRLSCDFDEVDADGGILLHGLWSSHLNGGCIPRPYELLWGRHSF
jgi:hypothetical protein